MREKEVNNKQNYSLELTQRKAYSNLDNYLKTPREIKLRQHQTTIINSLHEFLKEENTAGYISLPPGFGKTVVAAELIQAFGLKTAILSPTQLILEQTDKTLKQFAPRVSSGNYYADEKNLSGKVLNTTYHSFFNLLEKEEINPEEIELVICDEVHKALGEKRHKLFSKLPNALMIGLTATPYFTPLEGYRQRGLVDNNENWLGLFQNLIHEMCLEEAIERGILTNVDVHLMQTNAKVDDIPVTTSGEYDNSKLERYLNTEARNCLTVGLIAGVDKIPDAVHLPKRQIEELKIIHAKIKDKRTAIFGLSIAHIEQLAQQLRLNGISAETIHNETDKTARQMILKNHEKRSTQVILGVNILAEGWDSPKTEVGIFLKPTQSGIKAKQEFGRILRPCQESGKKRAIAIQMVDQFKKNQIPVLIPNLFDPEYVLRGTQDGRQPAKQSKQEEKKQSAVAFLGMNIESVIENMETQALIQRRFNQASIADTVIVIENLIRDIQTESPEAEVFEIYQKLAGRLPVYIDFEKQHQAFQAIADLDSNTAYLGRKALIFMNLKTMLSAVEPYLSDNVNENNEIVQSAIGYLWEKLANFASGEKAQKRYFSQYVYYKARLGAAQYIALRDNIPETWVVNGTYSIIKEKTREALIDFCLKLDNEQTEELSQKISEQTSVNASAIKNYIQYQNLLKANSYELRIEEGKDLLKQEKREILKKVLETLTSSEKSVIELRFGLLDGQEYTFTEIGQRMGIGRERVRQIMNYALSRLRDSHNPKRRILKELTE